MYIIKYKTFELPPFLYAYEIYNFIFFKELEIIFGIKFLSKYILLYINKSNF